MTKAYVYNCEIVSVIDGDTVDVDIDLGFDVILRKQRVRLLGVDTPESRTRDLNEKKFGYLAKAVVEKFCPVGSRLLVETVLDGKGKFGRLLGIIHSGTVNVNQYLIDNHYAVPYYGQNKDEIAEAHLANYQILIESGKDIL
jgi:micrococcal nuclease